MSELSEKKCDHIYGYVSTLPYTDFLFSRKEIDEAKIKYADSIIVNFKYCPHCGKNLNNV